MLAPFIRRYAWRGRMVALVGASSYAYREWTDGEKDYWNDALALGAVSLATANILTAGLEAAALGWATTKVLSGAGTIATVAAPIALGYVAGATVGTIVSEAVFGEGKMAYDLYTNPDVLSEGGIVYEIADMLGNAKVVFDHYNDAGHFSAREGSAPQRNGWHPSDDYLSQFSPAQQSQYITQGYI